MDDRIVFEHNSRAVAEAIEKRGARVIEQVNRNLGRGAHEVARKAQQDMPKFRSRTAVATGVDQMGPLEWHVRFGTAYAKYTEGGSGPGGQPTLAETLDWIRLKRIVPRTPGMTPVSLAHLIRRKIAARGVPAQKFASNALEAMRPRLVELIESAASQAMAGQA